MGSEVGPMASGGVGGSPSFFPVPAFLPAGVPRGGGGAVPGLRPCSPGAAAGAALRGAGGGGPCV